MASVGTEPAGLAKGSIHKGASTIKEGLEATGNGESDDEATARHASSPVVVTMLNGSESVDTRSRSPILGSNTDNTKTLLLVNENGTSEIDTPHGSVTGSNGFILIKPQQEGGVSTTPSLAVSPHRTNWMPSGSPTGKDKAKPHLKALPADTQDGSRTDPETGILSEGFPDSKNGPSPSLAPIPATVHRARKTMSRPAVSPAQKLLKKELREAQNVKTDCSGPPDTQQSSQESFDGNHLPQNPPDTPALAQTNAPISPETVPSASAAPVAASPKLQQGSFPAGWSRKKKRKMGTYSLVPKKKSKVLRQRTVLEMFKDLQQTSKSPEKKEESNINGERLEHAFEDEESEEEDSEEDQQHHSAEEEAATVQEETSEMGEDQYSEESGEEGEEEGTESDLSTESSLKKKLKKKLKTDGAWLKPSRKKKRRLKDKGELLVEPQATAAPSEDRKEFTQILTPVSDKVSEPSIPDVPTQDQGSTMEEAQELPLCSCRMETPKSREILILADRKCMATESVDGHLTRCQGAVLKQEMMRPSNSVQLLVLCEDHRNGMVKHQCCPGCGFFCRAGTFMECQPDISISHRFHLACASVLKGQTFCPHCGEEASKSKEVTIAKADTTSTVPPPLPHAPALSVAPEGRADTTTDSSSRTQLVSVSSDKADSSLSRQSSQEPDHAAGPGDSRSATLLASVGSTPVPPGPPKETLESVLVALDTEKPKKLRFHPKQLYLSAKQGELKKVLLMLVDGIDPNFKMEAQSKRTPLHAAAEGGYKDICHMLVQAGANLDMCDEDQRTPLMDACENNHMQTVTYLLRAGASVKHKDIEGFTCLHLAAKSGHYSIVEYLLSTKLIDIDCQDDGGWTALIWATEYKHVDQVKLLLSKGADISIRDKEQNICLHWAAFSGSLEIAKLLLNAHCDIHVVNIHGDSPLHIAARENRLECVTLFLSHGANVFAKNREGESPIDCSSHSSKVWSALQANRRERNARSSKREQKTLHSDISLGQERVPIPCVNSVDGEACPDDYKYIPENCVTSPMNIDRNITHLQYCVCKEDCSTSTCMCGQLSLRCWYDKSGCLLPEFHREEPPLIFECNHACSCWRTCKNRVVQNGLRTRLQLFRTAKKGWGVRTLQDIPKGTFVCEYVGEIISEAEADMRQNDAYLFSLDDKPQDMYCIDARFYGNISRFLNHMCEPNLFACRVFTTHQDLRFPHIGFFASESIKAGEELGFNYGDHFWEVKSKTFCCECGSSRCKYSSAAKESLQADSTPEEQPVQEQAGPDTSSSSNPL
ncbi:histone-lysine N-methyltransferase EHMT1 isoform X3 [Synchiropus splendidus]|uniref:histone-lysine N-methyltransferase EHMT1 isoform X3 n=1 Tax=Synchiropus splendidus TaxID=270530 RepID=UPI00237DB94A|nr:histone-lysine N-methyltransferase EHMT1 isoform X3 [Synchiropus splendidus]